MSISGHKKVIRIIYYCAAIAIPKVISAPTPTPEIIDDDDAGEGVCANTCPQPLRCTVTILLSAPRLNIFRNTGLFGESNLSSLLFSVWDKNQSLLGRSVIG